MQCHTARAVRALLPAAVPMATASPGIAARRASTRPRGARHVRAAGAPRTRVRPCAATASLPEDELHALRAAAEEAAEAGARVIRDALGDGTAAGAPRGVAMREVRVRRSTRWPARRWCRRRRRNRCLLTHACALYRALQKSSAADIVTEVDGRAEEAVIAALRSALGDSSVAILGEEGGVTGDTAGSELLWCVDPLDGTTNFAAGYPSFAVSVGCLFRGAPVAAAIVEFTGGPFCWATRTFSAAKGMGATCQGAPIECSPNDAIEKSLLVTGFGYDHGAAWAANMESFKHFTDCTRGVRRLGAAAVDLCHVALGIVDAYWEYNLSPWDVAAGVLIAEEAGALVTTLDGKPYSVFDRSMIAVTPGLQGAILDSYLAPRTRRLVEEEGVDLGRWKMPEGVILDLP